MGPSSSVMATPRINSPSYHHDEQMQCIDWVYRYSLYWRGDLIRSRCEAWHRDAPSRNTPLRGENGMDALAEPNMLYRPWVGNPHSQLINEQALAGMLRLRAGRDVLALPASGSGSCATSSARRAGGAPSTPISKPPAQPSPEVAKAVASSQSGVGPAVPTKRPREERNHPRACGRPRPQVKLLQRRWHI